MKAGAKFIFLDRDGVINKDPGGWTRYDYVTSWSEFHFLPGALEALALLKENGYRAIVISNQAGVGKGHFSETDLKRIDKKMADEVRKKGGEIAESFYCTHKEEENCPCRKPKTGLFDRAMGIYKAGEGACFVGDTRRDIIAGHNAGLETMLVLSGKAARKDIEGWEHKPDHIFDDLLEAVNWLVSRKIGGRR